MTATDLSDLEFRGREALLEQRDAMARKAGRPSPCSCERPRPYADSDGESRCFTCGKPVDHVLAHNGNGHPVLEIDVSVHADASRAEQLDAEIRQTATVIRAAWVHLAGCLHELHRDQHWRELGHESFASYLDSIELDRGYAYKLLRVFRTLVLGHGVDPHVLEGVNADKLDIAVRKGVSDVERVLADVRELTPKQLLERYRDELPPAPKCPTCRRALPRTGVAAKSQPRRFPLLDDRDWLAERYERMTQQQIADELGCKQVTVSQALRRHGIPTRPGRFLPQAA